MAKVVIAITTFRRPRMLEDALLAVEALDVGHDDVCVLVADNDVINEDGRRVVDRIIGRGYRFPLSCMIVEARGFTYGRNALLEVCFLHRRADFVAMMDDDQLPEAGWLSEMRAMQRATAADVVGPAVHPQFDSSVPTWVQGSAVFQRDVTTSGPVDRLFGDGGVLYAASAFGLLTPPYYDHRFALTGGADADLFCRLERLGLRFARAAEAKIHERYSASRLTVSWALRRAFRIGSADMLIRQRSEGRLRTAIYELPRVAAAFLWTPVSLVFLIGRPGRQVDSLCRLARAGGKVAGFVGSTYREYEVTHGQ